MQRNGSFMHPCEPLYCKLGVNWIINRGFFSCQVYLLRIRRTGHNNNCDIPEGQYTFTWNPCHTQISHPRPYGNCLARTSVGKCYYIILRGLSRSLMTDCWQKMAPICWEQRALFLMKGRTHAQSYID